MLPQLGKEFEGKPRKADSTFPQELYWECVGAQATRYDWKKEGEVSGRQYNGHWKPQLLTHYFSEREKHASAT